MEDDYAHRPLAEIRLPSATGSPGLTKEEVAKLYRDLPYLEAYIRHTDLRVASDPKQAIGARWDEMGLLQFNYLLAGGLEPGYQMLDIGCGTLRGGRHFIRYLNTGHYTGIDISSACIESGRNLVDQEGLTEKSPRLLWNSEPTSWFENLTLSKYDVLLAQSVFSHLNVEHIEGCFKRLPLVMHADSRFYFTFNEADQTVRRNIKGFGHPFLLFEQLSRENGFKVEKRDDYGHPLKQVMCVLEFN